MKKMKVFSLVLALLLALPMLAGCSLLNRTPDEVPLADLLDGSGYENDPVVYSGVDKLNAFEDASIYDYSGDLVLLRKADYDSGDWAEKYIVYNLNTNSTVYSEYLNDMHRIEIELYSYFGADMFTVRTYEYSHELFDYEITSRKTALYDAKGTRIALVDGITSPDTMMDYVVFDNKYYSVNERGTLDFAFNRSDFGVSLQGSVFATTDNYYYSSSSGSYRVYDKKLNLISSYYTPSYAESLGNPMVLEDGKMFLQYAYEVEEEARVYDLFLEGQKMNLVTVLIDPATGDAEEEKFDYVVFAEDMDEENSGLKDDVHNLAYIVPIEDHRINFSANNLKLAMIDADCKISYVTGVNGSIVTSVEQIDRNVWMVGDAEGREFLIDENVNVIGEVSGYSQMNDKYFLTNGRIYDYGLNMRTDYGAQMLTLEHVFTQSVLLTGADNKLVLYANGDSKTLIGEGVNNMSYRLLSDGVIVRDVSDSEYKIKVYNQNGELVRTLTYDRSIESMDITSLSSGKQILTVTYWNSEYYEYETEYYLIH